MSPQYHVLYNNLFESVPGCDKNQNLDLLNVDWPSIVERQGGSEINYDLEDVDKVPNELHNSWLTEQEIREKRNRELLRNQGCNVVAIPPQNAPIF